MRLGIADHLGWAIAVVADDAGAVVDRRRIALVEDGVTDAPVHYSRGALDDAALLDLIDVWRASVLRAAGAALDSLPGPIASISLRRWPPDFPADVATFRRAPWEARMDAVMYRQLLAELGEARGWAVHLYDAKAVEAEAGPLERLSPPWTKDHRVALSAALLAGGGSRP